MREVKFRAWDKEKKFMFEPLSLCLNIEADYGVERWGKTYVDHFTGEHEADRDFIEMEKIELLQYTGLKDKNGKEIYEGDLMQRCSSYQPKLCELYEVQWSRSKYILRSHNKSYFTSDAPMMDRMEIIGNIYENPDLLQEV